MQLCVTLLVKMGCVSQTIPVAVQRDTLVKHVMSLLSASVQRTFVEMEEHVPAWLQPLSAHVLMAILGFYVKNQVCHNYFSTTAIP